VFTKDFVELKIDVDRMNGGEELGNKLQQGRAGGLPWLVILDENGKELISSNEEAGRNIGSPAADWEVAHFMKMMRATRQHMSDEDIAGLEKDLNIHAERILRPAR
jgi:hypothetical protein